jgi:hypothetical protein
MMEFVNGKDDIPYMKWKIKVETTSRFIIPFMVILEMVYYWDLLGLL